MQRKTKKVSTSKWRNEVNVVNEIARKQGEALANYYDKFMFHSLMLGNYNGEERKITVWDRIKYPFVVIRQRVSHAWQALRYGECDCGGDY